FLCSERTGALDCEPAVLLAGAALDPEPPHPAARASRDAAVTASVVDRRMLPGPGRTAFVTRAASRGVPARAYIRAHAAHPRHGTRKRGKGRPRPRRLPRAAGGGADPGGPRAPRRAPLAARARGARGRVRRAGRPLQVAL